MSGFAEAMADLDRIHEAVMEGAVEAVEIISDRAANYARANHPLGTMQRPTNPDGSPRWLTRTGRAVGSIGPTDAKREGDRVVGAAEGGGPGVEYLMHLEKGTRRHPPFPAFGPAADKVLPEAPEIAVKAIESALERIGR